MLFDDVNQQSDQQVISSKDQVTPNTEEKKERRLHLNYNLKSITKNKKGLVVTFITIASVFVVVSIFYLGNKRLERVVQVPSQAQEVTYSEFIADGFPQDTTAESNDNTSFFESIQDFFSQLLTL